MAFFVRFLFFLLNKLPSKYENNEVKRESLTITLTKIGHLVTFKIFFPNVKTYSEVRKRGEGQVIKCILNMLLINFRKTIKKSTELSSTSQLIH